MGVNEADRFCKCGNKLARGNLILCTDCAKKVPKPGERTVDIRGEIAGACKLCGRDALVAEVEYYGFLICANCGDNIPCHCRHPGNHASDLDASDLVVMLDTLRGSLAIADGGSLFNYTAEARRALSEKLLSVLQTVHLTIGR